MFGFSKFGVCIYIYIYLYLFLLLYLIYVYIYIQSLYSARALQGSCSSLQGLDLAVGVRSFALEGLGFRI